MSESQQFFARPDVQKAIDNTLARIDTRAKSQFPWAVERNDALKVILSSMRHSPDRWSAGAQHNVDWVGGQFLEYISASTKEITEEDLDYVFAFCFRFLVELDLSMPQDMALELSRAKNIGLKIGNQLWGRAADNANFALTGMPLEIIKKVLNGDSINILKTFNDKVQLASELRKKWDGELEERERRTTALQTVLEKHQQAFNFVGLSEGFSKLAKKKRWEAVRLLIILFLLGALTLAPAGVEVYALYHFVGIDQLNSSVFLFSLIPAASFVIILLYYFRVVLSDYRSVKSQRLQIDLRMTLCQFIQDYANYAKDIKKQDADALSKFENVIFAGIVSDAERLPSTFDGVEQLVALIKSIKN